MDEEKMKAINALAGSPSADVAAPADTTDWKAKYEEAQRELNSARVEQGRVKKLTEEKKELERQLSEARVERNVQGALDTLPDNLKADTPEDFQRLAAYMAQQAVEKAVGEAEGRRRAELDAVKAQMAERDNREAQARQSAFADRIEQNFPGFFKSAVAEGGDKHNAWVQYQRYNSASINAAVQTCDFDTLSWHIRKFYTDELGIAAPSGGTGAAAPDPSTIGGGTPVAPKPGKTYTEQEISALYDEVEKARDMGDFAQVKRLGEEIDRAMREGRVK